MSIVAIVGPTASGKTARALEMARTLKGELISADSRQVYKKLSIGTAKPIGQWIHEQYVVQGIPYHLVDILEPSDWFSAAAFSDSAKTLIEAIERRGHQPIIVGGTGFYLKALTGGLAPLPPADPALRAALEQRAASEGRAALHAELRRVDPEAAERIPANNIARLVRALEIYRLTGKTISDWHREHRQKIQTPLPMTFIGLDPGPDILQRRIEERCRTMLENGMIEETQALLDAGCAENAPALSGLGYPRVIAYLRGEMNRDRLLALLIQDTRQYAKRQRTWFRHQFEVTWKTS